MPITLDDYRFLARLDRENGGVLREVLNRSIPEYRGGPLVSSLTRCPCCGDCCFKHRSTCEELARILKDHESAPNAVVRRSSRPKETLEAPLPETVSLPKSMLDRLLTAARNMAAVKPYFDDDGSWNTRMVGAQSRLQAAVEIFDNGSPGRHRPAGGRPRVQTVELEKAVLEMRRRGLSWSRIERELNVSRRTARRMKVRAGQNSQ